MSTQSKGEDSERGLYAALDKGSSRGGGGN